RIAEQSPRDAPVSSDDASRTSAIVSVADSQSSCGTVHPEVGRHRLAQDRVRVIATVRVLRISDQPTLGKPDACMLPDHPAVEDRNGAGANAVCGPTSLSGASPERS